AAWWALGCWRARVDDESKRRRQGLVVCRATWPLEGPLDARPGVTLAPTFAAAGGCLPVAHHPGVGRLGLAGELELGFAQRRPVGPHSGALAPQRRGAGADLEQAQLLGRQRWLLVGVVLAAGEQEPEQAHQLARARDDG